MNRYFWETASRLLLLLTFLPLYSCTNSFYHVGTLQSEQVKVVDEDFVFENEHLKVIYNFWENGGRMRYLLFNKTNQLLFIDWNNSFFGNNEVKTAYSQLPATSASTPPDQHPYVYRHNRIEPLRISARSGPVAQVPAEASVAVADFLIQQPVLHPNTKDTLFTYSAENSPLRLTHQISYSFNEALADPQQIRHSFWLKEIHVMEKSKITSFYGSLALGSSNAIYSVERRKDPDVDDILIGVGALGAVGVVIGKLIYWYNHALLF